MKGLPNLEKLNISGTQVSDAGLEHLKGLASLRDLDLSDTRISDAGLEHLKGLTNLRELDLSQTGISDAGLSHLLGLCDLRRLNLRSTKVTSSGIAGLCSALPVEVQSDFRDADAAHRAAERGASSRDPAPSGQRESGLLKGCFVKWLLAFFLPAFIGLIFKLHHIEKESNERERVHLQQSARQYRIHRKGFAKSVLAGTASEDDAVWIGLSSHEYKEYKRLLRMGLLSAEGDQGAAEPPAATAPAEGSPKPSSRRNSAEQFWSGLFEDVSFPDLVFEIRRRVREGSAEESRLKHEAIAPGASDEPTLLSK